MNLGIFFRLTAGFGIAIMMYLYLPVLELLETAFILAIGVFWALVVVDVILVSTGVIAGLGSGVSEWGTQTLSGWRDSVAEHTQNIREDLAARVAAETETAA